MNLKVITGVHNRLSLSFGVGGLSTTAKNKIMSIESSINHVGESNNSSGCCGGKTTLNAVAESKNASTTMKDRTAAAAAVGRTESPTLEETECSLADESQEDQLDEVDPAVDNNIDSNNNVVVVVDNNTRSSCTLSNISNDNNVTNFSTFDNAANTKKKLNKPNYNVRFSTIEIRYHPIIIGDNPSVTCGPPLTIDWQHDNVVKCNIDAYEAAFTGSSSSNLDLTDDDSAIIRRRKGPELKIPSLLRFSMLREIGYPRSEINQVIKSIDQCRKERIRTASTLFLTPVHNVMEKIVRKTNYINTTHRNKKAQERQYLKQCLEYNDNTNNKNNHKTLLFTNE